MTSLLGGCFNPMDRAIVKTFATVDCARTIDGVIRFKLRPYPDRDSTSRFEWSGAGYRLLGRDEMGIERKRAWGPEVQYIQRDVLGPGTELVAPYALSPDGALLVAVVGMPGTYREYSPRLAIVRLVDAKVLSSVELTGVIDALDWSPRGDAVVVLDRGNPLVDKETLMERYAKSIGHEIPYADMTLTIVSTDGKKICATTPANRLPYGHGSVRWD